MGGGRRRLRHRSDAAKAKDQKQDAIRGIDGCLTSDPVDVQGLRHLATVQGFVNNQLRSRVWPILIGAQAEKSKEDIELSGSKKHRDSHVVECDIQRSLWAFTEGWSEKERGEKREELRAVLGAAVTQEGEEIYYYQGLHDIASVLLFVCGVQSSASQLAKLANTHLRDFTRSSLDAALELLSLLPALLLQVDEDLARHIQETGIPPFYALSWLITWFSHTVQDLQEIARIFDFLLASHPLMPLYMCATIMQLSRRKIMKEEDPSEMHRLLTNLPLFEQHSVDEIAIRADRLSKLCPPPQLEKLSGIRLQMATAVEAKLEDGQWVVPEKKYVSLGLMPRQMALAWTELWLGDSNRGKLKKHSKKKIRPMRVVGGLGGLIVFSAVMYMSQTWQG